MAASTGSYPTAEQLLELEQLSETRFRSRFNQDNYGGSIFGGQPMAQALAAAQRTVKEWPAHSATGYYLRRGEVSQPVDYDVEIVRDGRRFAQRRILASQNGRAIFDMLCSYHDPEPGLERQLSEPLDVPDPEQLPDVKAFVEANADKMAPFMVEHHRRGFPIELRLMNPEEVLVTRSEAALRDYWFRMPTAAAVQDKRDHHCLLAFMSDYWFASGVGSIHLNLKGTQRPSLATVNHSLWIHAPVRVDEWLLYRTESPWGGAGRGLVRGLIYDRGGKLVANAVQEVIMRHA